MKNLRKSKSPAPCGAGRSGRELGRENPDGGRPIVRVSLVLNPSHILAGLDPCGVIPASKVYDHSSGRERFGLGCGLLRGSSGSCCLWSSRVGCYRWNILSSCSCSCSHLNGLGRRSRSCRLGRRSRCRRILRSSFSPVLDCSEDEISQQAKQGEQQKHGQKCSKGGTQSSPCTIPCLASVIPKAGPCAWQCACILVCCASCRSKEAGDGRWALNQLDEPIATIYLISELSVLVRQYLSAGGQGLQDEASSPDIPEMVLNHHRLLQFFHGKTEIGLLSGGERPEFDGEFVEFGSCRLSESSRLGGCRQCQHHEEKRVHERPHSIPSFCLSN